MSVEEQAEMSWKLAQFKMKYYMTDEQKNNLEESEDYEIMRPPTAEQVKAMTRDMLVFLICACPYSPFFGSHPRDID